MELVKSKGMVVFLVVVLSITIISSINTKKYDERNKAVMGLFILMLGFVYIKSEPINDLNVETSINEEIVYENK